MGNDRVHVRCLGCGAWTMMLHFMPGDFDANRSFDVLGWMERHDVCHPLIYYNSLRGNPGFELFTEAVENHPKMIPWLGNADPPDDSWWNDESAELPEFLAEWRQRLEDEYHERRRVEGWAYP